jgi:MoxR-like ATPase
VFDLEKLFDIAEQHRQTLATLAEVHRTLESEFYGFEEVVRALVLSAASGEPLLLIGAPGTAKSRIIRRFCTHVGVATEKRDRGYFEYLLTPFTEPPELWGYLDPAKLADGKLERVNEDLMMQNATVVFLDEFFKGSSAILNSLLSFMNERIFYDRGAPRKVALQSLFAATNELPESSELLAVSDRFPLRCRVANVDALSEKIGDLLTKAWPLTYENDSGVAIAPGLLDSLTRFRDDIRARSGLLRHEKGHLQILAQLVQGAREQGLSQFSNRRLVKSAYVMMVHRIYDIARANESRVETTKSIRSEELKLLTAYFLDDTRNEDAVAQMNDAIDHWAH